VRWDTRSSEGSKQEKRCTHESKTPKDIESGVRVICNGEEIFREHVVRPDSSSNVALGSFANRKKESQDRRGRVMT
jgi:hypothetical protein